MVYNAVYFILDLMKVISVNEKEPLPLSVFTIKLIWQALAGELEFQYRHFDVTTAVKKYCISLHPPPPPVASPTVVKLEENQRPLSERGMYATQKNDIYNKKEDNTPKPPRYVFFINFFLMGVGFFCKRGYYKIFRGLMGLGLFSSRSLARLCN